MAANEDLMATILGNNPQNYYALVNHIFFPRKLPDKESDFLVDDETRLLLLMTQTVLNLKSTVPENTRKLFKTMYGIESELPMDARKISTSIENLRPGEMFGLYIRKQNCGFSLYVPKDETTPPNNVIASTFEPSLRNEDVYSNSSDILNNFPQQSIKILYKNLIKSEEFAEQLSDLHVTLLENAMPITRKANTEFTELHDLPVDMYLSQWLTASASDYGSQAATSKELPVITKKIRDEIQLVKAALPFRRSGMWTTIKVFLQLNLTIELGPKDGKFLYKLIMLKILSEMCECLLYTTLVSIDADLSIQMLAKAARRIDKLSSCLKTDLELSEDLKGSYLEIREKTIQVIADVRSKLDKHFNTVIQQDMQKQQLSQLTDLNFKNDVLQSLPNVKNYLNERKNKRTDTDHVNEKPNPSLTPRHYNQNKCLPSVTLLSSTSGEYSLSLLLTDVEHWILHNFDTCTSSNVTDIRELFFTYSQKAKAHYVHDPVGGSRMILVIFKMLQTLDRIAIQKHPLLAQHHSGVNPKLFESLLLLQQQNLEKANELQTYFENRNNSSSYPGLLFEERPSALSFSSRYAKENYQIVRQQILSMAEEKIRAKELELLRAREELEKMRGRASRMSCEYYWTTNRWYERVQRHSNSCDLCSLKSNINNYKVSVYERPLRNEEHNQNAVVFELMIPDEIACLRDCLLTFTQGFCLNSEGNSGGIAGLWTEYNQISRFATNRQKKFQLASTTQLCERTRYGKPKHPDSSDDNFILNNGYNCIFSADRSLWNVKDLKEHSIKKFCTFKVEAGSPYSNLQWTIEKTSHTQNSVLASQADCSLDLQIVEYMSFGSLRADGWRLQLRNIFRCIASEALSFERSSVLSLILQALWEAGPNINQQWYRETNEDYVLCSFALETVRLLQEFLQRQENNWKHPLKLRLIIFITVRIIEINQDDTVLSEAVQLLLQCRQTAISWMEKIKTAKNECDEPADIENLRINLVDVAICGALTFFVNKSLRCFKTVVGNEDGISSWFLFIVTIANNILLSRSGHSSLSSSNKMFLRMVWNIGIHIEDTIKNIIDANNRFLNMFIKKQWAESRDATFHKWVVCSNVPQVIYAEVLIDDTINYVQIDIILGNFLVNGLPVSRLPVNITDNPEFSRLFGAMIFEVQPSMDSFTTINQYNSCYYIFKLHENNLVVKEQRESGETYELIPHTYLKGDVYYLLLENHSHWLNEKCNNKNDESVIEFRPKNFVSSKFSLPESVTYELQLTSGATSLIEVRTGRKMIDVRSSSCEKITEFLSRLEDRKYIHILMDKDSQACVELPRMRIKFTIDCSVSAKSYDLMSHEHQGMRVSLKQKFGTLIGLRNGLLLEKVSVKVEGKEKVNKTKKLLLMPHGQVLVNNSYHEPNVTVKNEELRKPPLFIYEIDDRCKCLRAQKSFSAWFYLAHLHAVTSYPLPDPFTGMTGTERTLQILQSGLSWSSEPYDPESITTLKNISRLTPVRSFYPSHLRNMQTINWPEFICSLSAHDGYKTIAEKLITDSERLKELHFIPEATNLKNSSEPFLNRRGYLRTLCFNPNASVTDKFFDYQNSYSLKLHVKYFSPRNIDQMRVVAHLSQEKLFHVPISSGSKLKNLLLSKSTLDGINDRDFRKIFQHVSPKNSNLHNIWIDLYVAVCRKTLSKEKLFLLLQLSIFEGCDFEQILILHSIYRNCSQFIDINPPPYSLYKEPKRNDFENNTVTEILRKYAIGESDYISKYEYKIKQADEGDREKEGEKLASEFRNKIAIDTKNLTSFVRDSWPAEECNDLKNQNSEVIRINAATEDINAVMQMWYRNRQLSLFLEKVGEILGTLQNQSTPICDLDAWVNAGIAAENREKFQVDFDSKQCQNLEKLDDLKNELWQIYHGEIKTIEIKSKLNKLAEWWDRFLDLSVPQSERHLVNSGLYPRLVPNNIFPKILTSRDENQRVFIGALAVLTTLDQREQRIENLKTLPHMKVIYQRELETIPHENWRPSEFPEWLLFEIEMNLAIRRVQVEVAKRMKQPPGDKHSVMQLNMGEGKTAVIVPILAAILGNEKHICQITVLKSLFHTNLKSLRHCLGGMLNRRLYTFPCRRDMKIEEYASKIFEIYQECKREKGIIMTLPEYRLSFQLKMYETVLKQHHSNGQIFLSTHKWLNENVRNILDESDAILHAKYQLIYTSGEQLPPDGGELRWTIAQALFKLIPSKLEKLWNEHGNEKIEFNDHHVIDGVTYKSTKSRPEVFWPCRILDTSLYNELIDSIADDFIEGRTAIQFPELRKADAVEIKMVITRTNISAEIFEKCLNKFENQQQQIILIFSGLLKYEILCLILSKRWRVNYGVNVKGPRKMAVPFKAKDVAAEMTEFGHPDVAICFTHLSYYYSGLSDNQLLEALDVLSHLTIAEEKYNDWLVQVPAELKSESIRSYSGINLADPIQREEQLFPILRFNTYVIDFWLSHCVFPREAKLFPRKMMCTAWDLCSENLQQVVTGFSGTNDTKLLLPLPIHQNDLPELEHTNKYMRKVLLRDENHYRNLKPNISGVEILEMLKKQGIPVLLDSGALMLELNNLQVAEKWLELVSNDCYDGAVYFDNNDVLMSLDRNGNQSEFELSVFRERLDRCVVYLDDTHTRGTDLKFPDNTRACVTLSGGITRDKTVQACMRMRMLGNGHTVSFWASEEAHNKIRQICNKGKNDIIKSSDVVEFICSNSDEFEKEGLVHWCAAGHNYTQKLSAHRVYENVPNSLITMSERCLDNEILDLKQLFGVKENVLLTSIMNSSFNKLKEIYTENNTVSQWITSNRDSILRVLNENIPDMKRFTQLLDEEQEKELEHELEEQRQVSRPAKANPLQPTVNKELEQLFIHGLTDKTISLFEKLKRDRDIFKLPYGLEKTTLWDIAQKDAWGDKIFVTKDFVSVISKTQIKDKEDEFLRPVWWIVSINLSKEPNSDSLILIILSPFECNHFIPVFRSANVQSTLHLFSPRTQLDQSLLINNANLHLPMKLTGEVKIINCFYLAELTLFSGSIYFETKEEQDAYSSFLGIIARPRSIEHQKAFDENRITYNGFVLLENRSSLSAELVNWCKFTVNPDKLVVKIAERRNSFLPAKSHVSLLVNESKKSFK